MILRRPARLGSLAIGALLLAACRPTSPESTHGLPAGASGDAPAASAAVTNPARPASNTASEDRRPAVIWNDVVIEWSELRPRLAERSGGAVVEEMLLDRRLEQLVRQRGITVGSDAIAAEERILVETLDPSSERAATLLRELRQVQGLGTKRWNDLLRRNASMRLLVQEQVQVSEEAVVAALDAAHGPKRVCRIIAAPDARSAELFAAEIAGGAAFADIAVSKSTDRSAERGGLLAPVSRLDPSYPMSFRNALWALAPGEISSPVLLDRSWVIIKCEREQSADSAINDPSAREKARLAVRRAQERIQMENLARSILRESANATVFDDALLESWNANRASGDIRR